MELPSYFAKYLQKIQPTRASRERAIQLHKTLRTRLGQSNDALFSSWFSGSFLYGSYIRNTAIQPIKDVDICILLEIDIENYTPEQVVRRLKDVLQNLGYKGKTAYQRRSVRIDMSSTTIDAVPVVPIDDEEEKLHIPDRKQKEWIFTYPKAHMKAATRINKECAGRYIPLVKIVKAWYRYQAKQKRNIERPKPKGFTLEALVATYQDPDSPSYAEAFTNFLQNLMDTCGPLLKKGVFPQVPNPGLPKEYLKLTFETDEVALFREIVEESLELSKQALEAKTIGESSTIWRKVFGSDFPEAPSSVKSLHLSEVLTEAEEDAFDPLMEAEISEIDLPNLPDLTDTVRIVAKLSKQKGGELTRKHLSGGQPVPKYTWIRFSVVNTTVSPPYDIKWTVENHGKEAREASDLGHYQMSSWQEPHKWEQTGYRGSHYMICEIIKSNTIVARTKHVVSIK
ncbi:MAG: hypothetical protein IT327_02920 [Anaerolineae bacterium]|nr:hypothetical protein [Anaerolineae bacterium]